MYTPPLSRGVRRITDLVNSAAALGVRAGVRDPRETVKLITSYASKTFAGRERRVDGGKTVSILLVLSSVRGRNTITPIDNNNNGFFYKISIGHVHPVRRGTDA